MLLKTRRAIASQINGRLKLANRLFWGGLVFSLSLHGIVMMLPWSIRPSVSDSLELVPAEVESVDGISVSILPAVEQLQVEQLQPVEKSQVPVSLVSIAEPDVPLPPAEPVWLELLSQPPVEDPVPAQPDVINESVEPAPLPSEELLIIEELQPLEEKPVLDNPKPEVVVDESPEHDVVVRLASDFPHLAGAQSGCYGLENCHRLEHGGNYRQAARQLMAQMQAQGYQVSERDDIDEPGHRVFDVIPPEDAEVTYYLNVFSDGSQSAVYALTLNILSLRELQQLSL